MSCEGCHISVKGQAINLEDIRTQAKNYAKDNNTTVAIYKEGTEYQFTRADIAISTGLPVVEYISQHH